MKIGFDLDGVLCDTDSSFLRFLVLTPPFDEDIETRKKVEKWYFGERKPRLDPELFIGDGDEYYVITGRDDENMGDLTRKWCRKHVPNAKEVCCVGEYWKPAVEAKAKKIVELGLDVYFDDHPEGVKKLRELLPGQVKIIQYGGQLD